MPIEDAKERVPIAPFPVPLLVHPILDLLELLPDIEIVLRLADEAVFVVRASAFEAFAVEGFDL